MVGSRLKVLAFLAISLGFVSIALFLPRDGQDETWRWLCLVFFGLCALVFAVLLVRPQRLSVDADGFAVGGGLPRSPRRRTWREVKGFRVFRLPRGGAMVGYDLADDARPDSYWGDLQRRWSPADGVLPRTLPGGADALADRLNACRDRALSDEVAPRRRTFGRKE